MPSSQSVHERPLNPTARLALVLSITLTIAGFYAFIGLALSLLAAWIAVEVGIALILARFGLSRLIRGDIIKNGYLLKLLASSLWLRRGQDFRIPLTEAQAPRLFACCRNLAVKLGVAPPSKLSIEMGATAWVELTGLGKALGRSHIGLGFDLLAGLNEREIEAVLAHELTHAKMVNRRFTRWSRYGLSRAIQLTNQLSGLVEQAERQKTPLVLVDTLHGLSSRLTRLCTRQIATYSRQDEFDADRGAASICGARPLRTALEKISLINRRLARLPWSERMAQAQSSEGLSLWLMRELSECTKSDLEGSDEDPAFLDPYSTHPSHRDRAAALADFPDEDPGESDCALLLLDTPDLIARELMVDIERKLVLAEKKDDGELRELLKRLRRRHRLQLKHVPAIACFVLCVGLALYLLATEVLIGSACCIIAGVFIPPWLNRLMMGVHEAPLPHPEYQHLFAETPEEKAKGSLLDRQKALEGALWAKVQNQSSDGRKAALLAEEACEALREGAFLRAHVEARLALEQKPGLLRAQLALLCASAALAQENQMRALIEEIQVKTSFRSPASLWAGAWALVQLGDWTTAEALLQGIPAKHLDHALLATLALCQFKRGKLHGAIANAEKALEQGSSDPLLRKLLIRCLLDLGDLARAAEQLAACEELYASDTVIKLHWLRLHLLQRSYAEAESILDHIEADKPDADIWLQLGLLLEGARLDAQAEHYFLRLQSGGHYPEVELAFARSALRKQDKERARQHVNSALDLAKKPAAGAQEVPLVFNEALQVLLNLNEPIPEGQAWVATLPRNKALGILAGRQLILLAESEDQARSHAEDLLETLLPNRPTTEQYPVLLELAPLQYQPHGSVRAGIHGFFRDSGNLKVAA